MKFLAAHRRWVFGGLIVASIALLIAFGGALVGFDGSYPLESLGARLVVIAVVVLLWLGFELFRAWRIRRKGGRLMTAVVEGGDEAARADAEADEEKKKLTAGFDAAMARLKNTRFGPASGSMALYQLPWYIFIGAPGSGKTTSLLNSGLRFPLAEPGETAKALSGGRGTRNCDWWFTDRAVLIDTAGRYMTQDSHAAVDSAAWKTFLRLLRQFRPRQPINGVLVTLSVQDLLSWDVSERRHYAQTVRRRSGELRAELGLEFPVYVLVTKLDLLPGFTDFFAGFDADQRAQVWGVTFDLDLATRTPEPPRSGFDRGFPALTAKLNELLFLRLQEERDADRRSVMYPFPQQFAALAPLISEFIDDAFGETRLQDRSIVRGVYFTSGTQQGAPIDRLLATLSGALKLQGARPAGVPSVGASKAYFITRLLKEVVFPEAALAGLNERRETWLRRSALGLLGVAGLLSLVFVGGATVSYFDNQQALKTAQPAAGRALQAMTAVGSPAPDDLAGFAAALDALTQIPDTIHDPVEEPPLSMRFGLYQGSAVADRVAERYRLALEQGLLPRVALQLERAMTAPQTQPEQVYAALRTYLMLYEPKRMEPERFVDAVSALWTASYPGAVLDSPLRHLRELASLPALPAAEQHKLNDEAVARARGRISGLSVVDRAYASLRGALPPASQPLRLSEVVGGGGMATLTRASGISLAEPIPALFTRDGYRAVVRSRVREVVATFAREEDWVMGERSSGVGRGTVEQIAVEVQRRYFSDFKAAWDAVLTDVRLRPLLGLADAMAVTQVLLRADSPLRKLVLEADRQTRLSANDPAAPAAAGSAASAVKRQLRQRAVNVLGETGASIAAAALPVASPAVRELETDLDQHFSGLRRLAGDGRVSEMDAATQMLSELASEFLGLQSKNESGLGVQEMPPAFAKIRLQATRLAPPVGPAILALTDFGKGVADGGVKVTMKAAVGGAAAVCARSLPGKYPFTRDAAQDLGVQDFVTVFKQGGELDALFNSTLSPYIDRSGAVWRLKPVPGRPVVSDNTVRQFQNAASIRSAFLGDGSAASVLAYLAVVSGDAELTLEYDGAVHKLKAGGPPVQVRWPAAPNARLSAGTQVLAAADGPWSLFRIVDKGVAEPGSVGDRHRVAYALPGGGRSVVEIRSTSSTFNPFRLRELGAFSCPRE